MQGKNRWKRGENKFITLKFLVQDWDNVESIFKFKLQPLKNVTTIEKYIRK